MTNYDAYLVAFSTLHVHMTIFSECEAGYFGLECNVTCSQNCVDPRSCDHVSGSCFGGCRAGWIRPNCVESNYSYGLYFIYKSGVHVLKYRYM